MDAPDIYDAEFEKGLNIAKEMIMKLSNREDQKICARRIKKLIKLQSNDKEVKKNRNEFLKYMIRILQGITTNDPSASSTDPLPHCFRCEQQQEAPKPPTCQAEEKPPMVMTRWSEDRKTYVSIKPLPNYGAIIYMAVTQDPDLGWEIPGGTGLS